MCKKCGVSRKDYEKAIETIRRIEPDLSEMSDIARSGAYKSALIARTEYEEYHNKK